MTNPPTEGMVQEHEALLKICHDFTQPECVDFFRTLPPDQADDFFLRLSSQDQYVLIKGLPPGERRIWLRLLPPDDVADLIQLANQEDREQLMEQLDEATRREVAALLAYKEDAAGGLMNPRFARLRPDMTVDEAITYLRRQSGTVEAIYYAYVLDESQRLLGVVSFRDLFKADRNQKVREIMRTDFIAATEHMDQEAVAKLVSTYHLLAVPVVDGEGRMVGVVTLDDIVDVVEEEASEDIHKLGGMESLDAPYLKIAFWSLVRKRAGWLAVLFIGEMLTATAMSFFEQEIARAVVLALFVPLIISSGGNSGSQATTLVIRAMAVGEIRLGDWFRIIRRELFAGLVLGSVLAAIGITRILLWQALWKPYGEHYVLVALTVAFSLIGVVMFGTIAGSMLPFILRRLRLDPASASAPFVATLVDVTGLVIYFTIASIVLRGTLL
ncbi:MAG TPA: magnesium transporter [Bryobacteraceae bacterium]|nr:magnesium transporter [Bryobacteraceae bacterium]